MDGPGAIYEKDKDGKDYIIFRVALNPRDRVTASKGE